MYQHFARFARSTAIPAAPSPIKMVTAVTAVTRIENSGNAAVSEGGIAVTKARPTLVTAVTSGAVTGVTSTRDHLVTASHARKSDENRPLSEAVTGVTGVTTEDVEERAAIIAEGTGAPAEWAHALARLHPDVPPGNVPVHRWIKFIDNCGRFIDEGWAEHAAKLGWSAEDLFGCDRVNAFARFDRAGLLWLMNGSRLVALAADSAVIMKPAGSRQTYHCVGRHGRILVWELDYSDREIS